MKEYIEREAAILALLDKGQRSKRYHLGDVWELNFDEIREAIASIPAADVRPVVFCRECKHYKPQEKKSARWENRAMMCTRSATIKMPPDGFCSFGKKTDVTDINVGNKKEAE